MKAIHAIVIMILSCCSSVQAEQCFYASGKTMYDAQQIRKVALSINWEVGKAASLAAGSFIKGKMTLYPQDTLEVCLKVTEKEIRFKAQSQAVDAGTAIWRNLYGKSIKAKTAAQ